MIPRFCANDTCGNELGEEDINFCSIDCLQEADERARVDQRIPYSVDQPEEQPRSGLSKRRRYPHRCFWCNNDFSGAAARVYCSAYCKLAAYRGGIRVKSVRSDRWAILDRDGFRCRYCGRSPHDGIKLHVDHVIPLSQGGSSKPDNLVTACQECNLGKNARAPSTTIP